MICRAVLRDPIMMQAHLRARCGASAQQVGCQLVCATSNARMPAMFDSPVVPKCRTRLSLRRRANQKHLLAHPASARGALRPIVTKREAGCGGRDDVVCARLDRRAKRFVSGERVQDERH
jgi:hypothetical protein